MQLLRNYAGQPLAVAAYESALIRSAEPSTFLVTPKADLATTAMPVRRECRRY